MPRVHRMRTLTALLLFMVGISALQATGALPTPVSADNTLTIQLVRTVASTDPSSASGSVQINLNTGQLTIDLNQATPQATYTATLLTPSTSSTLQLGYLFTDSNGAGTLQVNLSPGTYVGVFEVSKLGLVQYDSISNSFVIGSTTNSSATQSPTSQTATQSTQTSNSLAPNNTGHAILQVQPSSATIDAGAFAKFAIHVGDNSTADVFLVARGVPPDSVAIFTPNVGVANPDFNSSLTIVTSADTPASSYLVTAVAIVNGKELTDTLNLQVLASTTETSTTSTVNVSSATTLSMTVRTDLTQYHPNSTVNIQGQVTDSTGSAVPDASVSIQVDAPTGAEVLSNGNLHTDSAGIFLTQVNLGPSSSTGTYTVFTSASKPGYSSTTTRTTFVVGTSTTPSVIIKAVYAGDSAGNPTSTFTAGQTIWVWVVIQNIGSTFQGVVWIQVRDPNGVPVQIQIHIATLDAGETIKDGLGFTLLGHATIGVYTVNALVSDKLISQGGTFLASSETEFALIG